MTWTLDETVLSTSALQQVRATIGDTNSTDPLLTDEHIEWRLDEYSNNVVRASVRCVQDIIAKLGRDIDRSNVGMSASRSQKIQHYQDILKELKSQQSLLGGVFYGGTSTSAATTINSSTDYRQGLFKRGMDSNNTIETTDDGTRDD
jgi:hypothetical protein